MNPSPTNPPPLSLGSHFSNSHLFLRVLAMAICRILVCHYSRNYHENLFRAAPLTMSNRSVNAREVSCFCRSGADVAKNRPGWCQAGGN